MFKFYNSPNELNSPININGLVQLILRRKGQPGICCAHSQATGLSMMQHLPCIAKWQPAKTKKPAFEPGFKSLRSGF